MNKTDLNIQELLTGPITRLSHVRRWAVSRGNRRESVADHSYYVTLYCLMIYRWWTIFGEPKLNIDLGILLSKATLHDIEECYIGDIPYPVKHGSAEIQRSLDDVARMYVLTMLEKWSSHAYVISGLLDVWMTAKDITLTGRIVEFAEALSRLSYIAQEVQSNPNFLKDLTKFPEYMSQFSGGKYDFIRPLVTQALDVTDEIFSQTENQPRAGAVEARQAT